MSGLGGLALVLGLSAPAPARAWTEAEVSSVQAAIQLDDEGMLHVELQMRVEIARGWLEVLEIAGLDEDLEVEGPAVFVDTEGQRMVAESRMNHGSLELVFPRREAPRRGQYRARVRFRSVAWADRIDGERASFRWTLPGWRAGLNGVEVRFDLPADAHFRLPSIEAGADETGLVERERRERDGRTELLATRVHLPRTVPWTLEVEVPRRSLRERPPEARTVVGATEGAESDPGTRTTQSSSGVDELPPATPTAAAERSVRPAEASRPAAAALAPTPLLGEDTARWIPPSLAVLAALLALWGVLAFRHHTRRRHARARPLIGMPLPLRLGAIVLVGAMGALGHLLFAELPLPVLAAVGVTLLAAQKNADTEAVRFGVWRSVPAGEMPSRALLPEVGSALGFTIVVALLTVATAALAGFLPSEAYAIESSAAAAALPLLLGLRHRLPLPPSARRAMLQRWAKELRLEGIANEHAEELEHEPAALGFQLAMHFDEDDIAQDARLRVILAERPRGLVRLDLAIAETEAPGGLVPVIRGIVVTREKSPAELALRELLQEDERRPLRDSSGRYARILTPERLLEVATQLRDPGTETVKRRTTPRRVRTTSVRRPRSLH